MATSEITITDLTESKIDGNGVFDQLMGAVEEHICAEFAANRITGPTYSTVYLGGLQTVVDQSIRFLLERKNAELLAKQIEKIEAELVNIPKEGLLLDQRLINLVAEKDNLDAREEVLKAEKLKIDAEVNLLAQKLLTEKAQIEKDIAEIGSTVDLQNQLYDAQTKGYSRDAEQKATDIMTKVWSVSKTMDETVPADMTNRLEAHYIGETVKKLLEGVEVDVTTVDEHLKRPLAESGVIADPTPHT